MWSGQGPGPGLNMIIVLRAGPGHVFCGPVLIIKFLSRARARFAQLLRARASIHISGPGVGLNFRPVQGPSSCCPHTSYTDAKQNK